MAPGKPARHTRRRFGQHFLVRPDIARRIVDLAELNGTEPVVEIGPGRAALSDLLAETAGRLWLIEVDRDLCRVLQERFASRPHVHVVEGDALSVDFDRILPTQPPTVVVANLPYNISTPILMKLLAHPARFRRLVLMLQREVAERLAAPPGTRTYGALSIMVQLVSSVRLSYPVPPSAFHPPPAVRSRVVVLDPIHPPPLSPKRLAQVRRVVRAAFSQRRKQLCNALASIPVPSATLEGLGIDPRRRPETLTPAQFIAIASSLHTPERDPEKA